ncbi:MAG: PTS sugar transporter subunit IIA [Phycisphaerales bacterium]|nr:PTS sugar transporter subunit IIA [Phycisphaerales bacterium]
MKLTEIIQPDAIRSDLESVDRDQVIAEMIDMLVTSGAAPADIRDELLTKILDRERKSSTGFGYGVAVPHIKHPKITKLTAGIGLSERGIDFESRDKLPVYTVVMLLTPADQPEDHLQAMETIFKNLSKETFRRAMRQTQSNEQVVALLDDADHHRLGEA